MLLEIIAASAVFIGVTRPATEKIAKANIPVDIANVAFFIQDCLDRVELINIPNLVQYSVIHPKNGYCNNTTILFAVGLIIGGL